MSNTVSKNYFVTEDEKETLQTSSGGSSNICYLSLNLTNLTSNSTEDEITAAFGGEDKILEFKNAVKNNYQIVFEGEDTYSNNTINSAASVQYAQYIPEGGVYFGTSPQGLSEMYTIIFARFGPQPVQKIILGGYIEQYSITFGKNLNSTNPNTFNKCMVSVIRNVNRKDLLFFTNDLVPIGSGMDYYGTTPPENYMFADGSAISRTEYQDLFKLLGTTYGEGDGSTTFNLPDKRTRVTVMKDNGTFNELGKKGGEETHTLTINEIPHHAHSDRVSWTDQSTVNSVTVNGVAVSASNVNGWMGIDRGTYTGGNGGGQAHNNLQPYLVCNYIIKVK